MRHLACFRHFIVSKWCILFVGFRVHLGVTATWETRETVATQTMTHPHCHHGKRNGPHNKRSAKSTSLNYKRAKKGTSYLRAEQNKNFLRPSIAIAITIHRMPLPVLHSSTFDPMKSRNWSGARLHARCEILPGSS